MRTIPAEARTSDPGDGLDITQRYLAVRDLVVGREEQVRSVLAVLAAGRDLLLEGPPGTSKSTILRAITGHYGIPLVFVEGNADLTPQKLIGYHDPARVLRHGYRPEDFVAGPLPDAMARGGFLYIEEFNRVPEDTLNAMLTAMAERELTVPRVGRIPALDSFRLVVAMNPFDNVGTSRVSVSIYDRLCRLAVGYQSAAEEREIVALRTGCAPSSDVVALAVELVRASREHPDLRTGSSVRGRDRSRAGRPAARRDRRPALRAPGRGRGAARRRPPRPVQQDRGGGCGRAHAGGRHHRARVRPGPVMPGSAPVPLVGRRAERRMLVAGLRAGRDLLVEGPAGTGKSLLVRDVAAALERRMLVVEGSAAITAGALLGHHDPAHVMRRGFDAAGFVDGPLLVAMRRGWLLHVEEANRMPPGMLDLLLGPLDERRIAVPRVGEVGAAPGFGLVATANDGDPGGTHPLGRAFAERLVRLRLHQQRAEEERTILRRHDPATPAWLVGMAVTVGRATREHPDLVRGASVRGSIDLAAVARQLARLEDVDLRDRDPASLDVVIRAALVALSGRVAVRDAGGRSAEDVIREIWEDEAVVRVAAAAGSAAAVALPSAIVRRGTRPAWVRDAGPDRTVEPSRRSPGEPGAGAGGAAQVSRSVAGDTAGSTDPGNTLPPGGTALTDQELDDLTDLVTGSAGRATRRHHRRRLAGIDPALVHRLAMQIVVRRARQTRGRRGTGTLRPARFRFQSDDLDLDRSLEELAANPYPGHEDIWVQERSAGRRGVALMLDVSGSMRGAPLIRAALAAASAAAATAGRDDLATVLFWSRVAVVTSVENPQPVTRVVEDVLAVRPEGLTDISLGLVTGLRLLEPSRARDKIGILVTDGVSNHGGDPATVARRFPRLHVLATATAQARLQACGRLAAAGHGECVPVPGIDDIPDALTRCLNS
ncbi:AAA family ATPase [Pseudonocardia sp.]|uniref:AAA family ATPase n=1 Tax=Pseudonocardia sp. TaxID=60912 RepID=UPI00260949F8|nr:AAA family ATPase [Pseudonocardia sp.]